MTDKAAVIAEVRRAALAYETSTDKASKIAAQHAYLLARAEYDKIKDAEDVANGKAEYEE